MATCLERRTHRQPGLKALMRLQDVLLIRVQAKLSRWIGSGKFEYDTASTISTDINHINQLISQSCRYTTVQVRHLPDHHCHGHVVDTLQLAAIPSHRNDAHAESASHIPCLVLDWTGLDWTVHVLGLICFIRSADTSTINPQAVRISKRCTCERASPLLCMSVSSSFHPR